MFRMLFLNFVLARVKINFFIFMFVIPIENPPKVFLFEKRETPPDKDELWDDNYVLLKKGETIQADDEVYYFGEWHPTAVPGQRVGSSESCNYYRRKRKDLPKN